MIEISEFDCELRIYNASLYLSHKGLCKKFSVNTVKCWGKPLIIDGLKRVPYNGIPSPSRSKLPPKEELWAIARQQERDSIYQHYRERADKAILENFSVRRAYLMEKHGKELHATTLNTIARKWCVVDELIIKKRIPQGENHYVRQVLNDLFDNWFTAKEAYCRFKKKVQSEGVGPGLIYFRVKKRKGRCIKFSQEMQERFIYFYSDDRQFSMEKIKACLEAEFDNVPSRQIFDRKVKELKNDLAIFAARYGNKAAKQQLPYQRLKIPEYANSKWEIDGVSFPYYTVGEKNGKQQGFQRWVLVRVIDVCSRKIIGLQVAPTETGHVILKALEDAVRKTGYVPAELVMDVHSGTQLADFKHFEKHAFLLGCTITKTLNPQGKATIERYNQHLDAIAKCWPEWLGENIAASKPIRRSDETMRELAKTKNMLSYDETIARGYVICKKFNEAKLSALNGLTPETRYDQAEKRGVKVNEADINAMFAQPKEYNISRGMITIKRGTKLNTYTLPTGLIREHNNKKVLVHSFDIDGFIYVFDMQGNHIADIPPDVAINSSITERRPEEKPKQFGIATGAKSRANKAFEDLKNNPESAAFIPAYMINKGTYQEIQQNASMQQMAKVEGLKVERKHKTTVHVAGETKYNLSDPELDNNELAILPDAKDFLFPKTKKVKPGSLTP